MTKPREAAVRQAEILDAAQRLFVAQGYEQTSVQQLLEAIGIAKGTFYHHFSSKEAVMDGIIERHVQQMRARAEQVVAQPGLDAQRRLVAAVLALQVQPGAQEEMLTELNRPQNVVFHQRTLERTLEVAVPILAGVVRAGIAEGVFRTDHPEQALELILLYTAHVLDDLDPQDPQAGRTIQAFVHHTELLLGAAPGSLGFVFDLFAAGPR